MSDESIKPFPTSDNSLTPAIDYYNYKIRVKLHGSILRQPKVSYTHKNLINIYIIYELVGSSSHSDDPTRKNCLFGAVKMLILISMGILIMELDLIEGQAFHFQVVDLVKMY